MQQSLIKAYKELNKNKVQLLNVGVDSQLEIVPKVNNFYYHMEYFILTFIVSVLLLIQRFNANKVYTYALLILLISFAGLRENVGVDYSSYIEIFAKIANESTLLIEPGVLLLSKLVFILGGNEQAVLLSFSIFTVIFFYRYISFFSKDIFVSMFFFSSFGVFFLASLSLVKQYMAISIFVYALIFLWQRSFVKYASLVIIGGMFHYSALLLIPLYFICHRIYKIWQYILILILALSGIELLDVLVGFSKYSIYLEDSHQEVMLSDRNSVFTAIYLIASIIVICTKDAVKKFKGSEIFINMSFISLVIILGSFLSDLPNMFFFRFNNYFITSNLILVTYYIYLFTKTSRIIITIVFCCLVLAYMLYTVGYNGERYSLTPYSATLDLID